MKSKVLISVSGGVAEVVACPENVEVEIRDFDNNRELENDDPDYCHDFSEEEIAKACDSSNDLINLLVELRNAIRWGDKVPQMSMDVRISQQLDFLRQNK